MTSGVMVAQDRVTPPVGNPGLLYPLIGLTWTRPWPPLPALTLLGDTAFCTVMVNCGVTDRTVRFSGWVVTTCPVEAATPVMEI